MIKKGEFREDLFYRLNVLPIQLPPLRERKNDIEHLARYFIDKFNQQHRKSVTGIAADAMALLKAHSWPGNIRELENVIEHAFVIESGTELTTDSLPDSIRGPSRIAAGLRRSAVASDNEAVSMAGALLDDEDGDLSMDLGADDDSMGDDSLSSVSLKPGVAGFKLDIQKLDFQASKEEFERQFLISALKAFNGRINQTAMHANIPKKTLLRKLEKYGINARDYS